MLPSQVNKNKCHLLNANNNWMSWWECRSGQPIRNQLVFTSQNGCNGGMISLNNQSERGFQKAAASFSPVKIPVRILLHTVKQISRILTNRGQGRWMTCRKANQQKTDFQGSVHKEVPAGTEGIRTLEHNTMIAQGFFFLLTKEGKGTLDVTD